MRLCLVSADLSIEETVRAQCEPALRVVVVSPHEVESESLSSDREVEVIEALSSTHAILLEWDFLKASLVTTLQGRVSWIGIPIIAICETDAHEQAAALASGADAVITVPISPGMLKAQVMAHRRTMESAQRSVLLGTRKEEPSGRSGSQPDQATGETQKDSRLCINRSARRIESDGRELQLTPREYELLHLLMENEGEVVTRDRILDAVWGLNFDPTTNTLEVYIHYLRRILSEHGHDDVIETVRGVGYRYRQVEREDASQF
jgi:DNA-binding response OmpR family regulator